MPMLTPYVWALDAPHHVLRCANAVEAVSHLARDERVLLPDYSSAVRTLIMIGVDADRALYLAQVAREQPQAQDSY